MITSSRTYVFLCTVLNGMAHDSEEGLDTEDDVEEDLSHDPNLWTGGLLIRWCVSAVVHSAETTKS